MFYHYILLDTVTTSPNNPLYIQVVLGVQLRHSVQLVHVYIEDCGYLLGYHTMMENWLMAQARGHGLNSSDHQLPLHNIKHTFKQPCYAMHCQIVAMQLPANLMLSSIS